MRGHVNHHQHVCCSWSRRADTELRLAHFRRHREGAGEKKGDLAAKARRKQAGQHVGRSGPPPKWGLDHDNPVTKLVAKVRNIVFLFESDIALWCLLLTYDCRCKQIVQCQILNGQMTHSRHLTCTLLIVAHRGAHTSSTSSIHFSRRALKKKTALTFNCLCT